MSNTEENIHNAVGCGIAQQEAEHQEQLRIAQKKRQDELDLMLLMF